MAEDELQVKQGDWFVHAHFGVGKVKGQDVKCVAGQEQAYYEIETIECTLWLPEEQFDGQKIRPLANHDEFQQAIEILERPSRKMAPEANKRKNRIKAVKSANLPEDTARLVRDLLARQRTEGKLYEWERQAWRDSCAILIQEWILCLGVSADEASRQMARTLRRGQAKTAAGETPTAASSLLDSVTEGKQEWAIWLAEVAD